MRALAYLRDRFNEAGSKRSLAVVLFAVSSATNSVDLWEAAFDVALVLLGAWSFLQRETKPVVVVADTLTAGTVVVEPKP